MWNVFYKIMALVLISMGITTDMAAQELNATVSISTSITDVKIPPTLLKTLERSITDYLNNRKWTDDNYALHEKINCIFFINITSIPKTDVYAAQLTLQSSRPVFNTSYNTQVLKHIDKDILFLYRENDPIEHSDNAYVNNLASTLSFYAYMILGYDYDTYAFKGGNKYFEKADNIANLVPFNSSVNGEPISGWKATDSRGIGAQQNRYWLVTNLMNVKYDNIRKVVYQYHTKGMDLLYNKAPEAKKNILECIALLQEANATTQIYTTTIFMSAKVLEIINIYSDATSDLKKTLFDKLSRLDPVNSDKYTKAFK
jgi:hypothetical protein